MFDVRGFKDVCITDYYFVSSYVIADQYEQDQQRRSIIDELQNRLTSTLEITRQLEEQNGMQQESVSQISKKVSNLFFKLQCDQMDTKGQFML